MHKNTSPQGVASASPTSITIPPRRRLALVALAVATMLAFATLTACGSISQSAGGEYDYSCPSKALVTVLDFDLSGSGRAKALLGARLDDAQVEVERTGDCDGRLIVGAHSNSSAATVTLLDVELHPSGATEIARDRKLGPLVEDTMEQLRSKVNAAMRQLASKGSDLTAAATFVSDQASQYASPDTSIEATIYSDAISNVGPLTLNNPKATIKDGERTAARAPKPAMRSLNDLRVEGIGHVAGSNQPPSDYVNVIRAQVLTYLKRSGAAHTEALTTLVGR